MRRNGRLFIILGVGLATLAVALAFLMFNGADSGNTVNPPVAQVRVVVAAQDVPAHTILRDEMLLEQLTDPDLAKGADVNTKSQALGKAPKTGLIKGQRLAQADLEAPSLTNDIERGKRGLPVPVDRLSGLNGMLREGDYVDVIFSIKVNLLYVLPSRPIEVETGTAGDRGAATLPPQSPNDPSPYVYPGEAGSRFKVQGPGGGGDPTAKVVIQDVKVLRAGAAAAAAAQAQPGAQPTPAAAQQAPAAAQPDIVMLEVTDEQAEVMKFILDNGGSYAFVLRAKDDHDRTNTNGITWDLMVTNYQLPVPKSVRLPGEKQP
jgi:Flp pilus assembly protein CpaB